MSMQDDYCDDCGSELSFTCGCGTKTRYIVWVGGTQVNDYYIDTLDEAKETAELYEINGYDDVKIEEINE